MKLVGYYQACERLDETALAPVGEKVASKIKESFKDAVAFVIDGEHLGTDHPALIPFTSQSSSTWRPSNEAYAPFTSESSFKLSSPTLPRRAVELVRDNHAQQIFGDFDDHLEDVTIGVYFNGISMAWLLIVVYRLATQPGVPTNRFVI
ncbi:hypothetical protein VNI00_000130 [Paramarasmius palmivorus]|uniref:Uncharacterized protein n=1 Tax=Paramarasmius palmivorus TaxID=297713 RepID=A0AAW0EGH5_9AGAR